MKKFLLLTFCTVLMLSGCTSYSTESRSTAEETASEINTETAVSSEIIEESVLDIPVVMPVTEISDNIKLYDLSFPENIEYRSENKVRGVSYEMPEYGKIIEKDRNICLENSSGETDALIELPFDYETVYAMINFVIDDSRFAYIINQEDFSLGCGVYNLADGSDFRIKPLERCCYFPQYVSGEYLILSRGFINEHYGYSKLDLNTFELTDIDSQYILENMWTNAAFADDGKTAAAISQRNADGEYTVTLFSLSDDKKINEYIFVSDKEYISFTLEFVLNNKLYVYVTDNEFNNYLYVIDVSLFMG